VIAFFKTIGLTHEYFSANNESSFVLEQHILYIAEVREEEKVSLRTRVTGRSERRLHFQVYLVKDDTTLLAATSKVVTVHIDWSCRRISPLPTQDNVTSVSWNSSTGHFSLWNLWYVIVLWVVQRAIVMAAEIILLVAPGDSFA